MIVEVVDDAAAAAARVAALVEDAGATAVGLSGGSTPRAAYELLGLRGTLRDADVWLVDERCVPPDAPESNARLVRETLGDVRLHRVRGEDPPDEAARVYDEEIEALLGREPVLDLIVLGMGGDGHTASLFPDAPELDERERRAVATRDAHAGFRRVTLTLPVLNAAREKLFLVTGYDKAPAFARIRDGELLPAGRILGARWIVDREAAEPPARLVRRRKGTPIEGQESLF